MTSLPMADAITPSDDQQTNDCNLIVNYLPWMMSQEEVRRLFSRVGAVDSCRLVKDKKTGQSLGYAFVRYRSRSLATRAIQTFNGFRIQNKIIKVSVARPRCSRLRGANVYVSGLERTMTSVDLDDLFRPFGTIISCRVLCDERTGLSRGVGFVLFNLRSEAETAIRSLNATVPHGAKQPIRLKFATRPTTGLPRPRFLPLLPAAVTLPPMGTSSCGRVMNATHFVGPTRLAVKLTPPDELDVIRCNLATTKVETVHPLNTLRPTTEPVNRQVALVVRTRNQNGESTPDGDHPQPLLLESEQEEEDEEMTAAAAVAPLSSPQSTIVVRNLPGDVDESTLWRLFGPLGAVQDIRLQGDRPTNVIGQHTVFQEAIVTMKSAREAALAIRLLDGLKLEKLRNRSGELEMLMEDTQRQQQQEQQQQQQRPCDGRLLGEFGQSFCLGKDFDVCQGQGSHLGQTKAISQGRLFNKSQQQIADLEMDQGFIPTAAGVVGTQGLTLCQGQAIDRRLWTNPGGYTTINPTACCWLNHLESYGFSSCSQPGYISISPQDILTTFNLSCS